jgi:hypothetical protein
MVQLSYFIPLQLRLWSYREYRLFSKSICPGIIIIHNTVWDIPKRDIHKRRVMCPYTFRRHPIICISTFDCNRVKSFKIFCIICIFYLFHSLYAFFWDNSTLYRCQTGIWHLAHIFTIFFEYLLKLHVGTTSVSILLKQAFLALMHLYRF